MGQIVRSSKVLGDAWVPDPEPEILDPEPEIREVSLTETSTQTEHSRQTGESFCVGLSMHTPPLVIKGPMVNSRKVELGLWTDRVRYIHAAPRNGRLEASTQNYFGVGDRVEVWWRGNWWPAVVASRCVSMGWYNISDTRGTWVNWQ